MEQMSALPDEGKEIQQHLQPAPVQHVRVIEALFAGLVVHNADIGPSAALPDVYTVNKALHNAAAAFPGKGHTRQCAVRREFQLTEFRAEGGDGQLVIQLVDDLRHLVKRPPEQIARPARVREGLEQGLCVLLHALLRQFLHPAARHGGKPALALRLLHDILQHVVHERAVEPAVEFRRFAFLRPQAVLQKMRKAAPGQHIDARGGEVQLRAIERPRRLRPERAGRIGPGLLRTRGSPGKHRLLQQAARGGQPTLQIGLRRAQHQRLVRRLARSLRLQLRQPVEKVGFPLLHGADPQ